MTVKTYRKKPLEVEAIQWVGNNYEDIIKFMKKHVIEDLRDSSLIIPTLEGDMKASIDDFIIKGIKGEFYPCKPDIFWETYDGVDDD